MFFSGFTLTRLTFFIRQTLPLVIGCVAAPSCERGLIVSSPIHLFALEPYIRPPVCSGRFDFFMNNSHHGNWGKDCAVSPITTFNARRANFAWYEWTKCGQRFTERRPRPGVKCTCCSQVLKLTFRVIVIKLCFPLLPSRPWITFINVTTS